MQLPCCEAASSTTQLGALLATSVRPRCAEPWLPAAVRLVRAQRLPEALIRDFRRSGVRLSRTGAGARGPWQCREVGACGLCFRTSSGPAKAVSNGLTHESLNNGEVVVRKAGGLEVILGLSVESEGRRRAGDTILLVYESGGAAGMHRARDATARCRKPESWIRITAVGGA